MRWLGHVPCTGEKRDVYRVLVGHLKVRDYLEDVIHISGGCFKMDCKETEWEVQTGLI
jgi:hypothetical protein